MSYSESLRQRGLLASIFNESTDALLLVDPDRGVVADCNPRAVALFQAKDRSTLIDQPSPHLQANFDRQERAAIDTEERRQGYWSREVHFQTRRGQGFWGSLAVKRLHLAGGQLMLVRITDISQHKQAEALLNDYNRALERQVAERTATLESREALLRNMAMSLPGALIQFGLHPDGQEILHYISPGCQDLWEVDVDTLQGNPALLWSMVLAEDLAELRSTMLESAETLNPLHQEWRILTPSGKQKWLQGRGRPQRQDDSSTLWTSVVLDITERKRAELALARSEQQIGDILDSISDAFFSLDRNWCFTFLNPRAEELLRHSARELLGCNVWDSFPDSAELEFHRQYRRAVTTQQAVSFEEYFPPLDRWFQVNAYPFEGGLSVYFQDVTDRVRAEAARRESEARYRLLAENMSDLVCLHDTDGRYRYVSPSVQYLLDYPVDQFLGQSLHQFIHPEDQERVRQASQVEAGEATRTTYRLRHRTRDYLWVETLIQGIADEQHGHLSTLLSTTRDVNDRVLAEQQLRFDALHDSLTGLANRTLLSERLDLALRRQGRQPGACFAVLFLDLNRFKVINDSLGHQVGDQLLVAVAESLRGFVREVDLVARISGDEFAILLENLTGIDEAIQVAERISAAFRHPFMLADREVYASTSIGIVLSASHYRWGSEILRDADIAMYRAKTGGTTFEIFDPVMHAEALARAFLENDLRLALRESALELHYQPIFALGDGRIIGFEALARWQHPERGMVLPTEFIPVAEEIGLISELGLWVLREACGQMVRLETAFPEAGALAVSVNLSPRQLRSPDLVKKIIQILRETGFSGQRLILELTESMLVDNAEAMLGLLRDIRTLGVRISIDDFGTGYSSLSYLHRFPVSSLKIDQSFVSRIQGEDDDGEIAEVILTLGRQLGLDVVAEGIETQAQLCRLQAMDCKLGQGYLFSRPVPAPALQQLLNRPPRLQA